MRRRVEATGRHCLCGGTPYPGPNSAFLMGLEGTSPLGTPLGSQCRGRTTLGQVCACRSHIAKAPRPNGTVACFCFFFGLDPDPYWSRCAALPFSSHDLPPTCIYVCFPCVEGGGAWRYCTLWAPTKQRHLGTLVITSQCPTLAQSPCGRRVVADCRGILVLAAGEWNPV